MSSQIHILQQTAQSVAYRQAFKKEFEAWKQNEALRKELRNLRVQIHRKQN